MRASMARVLLAPYEQLRPIHRVRLGLADGRLGTWDSVPAPDQPLYRDRLYWDAYRCQARLRA